MSDKRVAIIGGGLAGCEAAGVLSRGGVKVVLYEQKPVNFSPAHKNSDLGELVCSNSLKSERDDRPQGWLKSELRALGSMMMEAAEGSRLPGGEALVVDRFAFSKKITERILSRSNMEVIRQEVTDPARLLDEFDCIVVATGPLTSGGLVESLEKLTGGDSLYFYDAISPIISAESIDNEKAFRASRYGRGGDDYINCPMTEENYISLREAILGAEKVEPHSFEKIKYFEACLPIETIAERGELALAYGPLSPAGLIDPVTGRRPYCVLQLRQENTERSAYSLVAFQTKMKFPEQERVLRLIPALKNAEILRFGSIHRNTFVDAPSCLSRDMSLKSEPRIFLAGVLTGVEGYCESSASGILAGLFALGKLKGIDLPQPPYTTCVGALQRHVKGELHDSGKRAYQPMNMNRGIMPEFQQRIPKKCLPDLFRKRAAEDLKKWIEEIAPVFTTGT